MSDRSALLLLRWAFCLYIAWANAETLRVGLAAHDIYSALLAGLELPAIAAFAWPRLERVAGAALLIIFAAASLIAAVGGEVSLHLFFYGTVAAYICYSHRRMGLATTSHLVPAATAPE